MKLSKVFCSVLLFAMVLFTGCEDKQEMSLSQMPQTSQDFLSIHFPGVKVTQVIKDIDDFSYTWDVYLENGFEVEFDKNGNWLGVDGRNQPIPESILALIPQNIVNYCSTNYLSLQIVEIDRDDRKYDIGLSGGMDLEFDLNGNFLKIG